MGLRCVARLRTGHHGWQRGLRASASYGVLALAATALFTTGSWADVDAGTTVKASTLSGSGTTMNGGTVQFDEAKTLSRDWTFKDVTGNTFDAYGTAATLSGKLTGAGAITITDSKGGGVLTLTNSNNNYTGFTTINSGATLALLDSDTGSDTNTTSGTIMHSAQLVDNGTFDISGTVSGATVIALSGSGKVVLGAETLTINNYDTNYDSNNNTKTYSDATTFSGVISGTGSVVFSTGGVTLTGINTYTGSTSISAGTITLAGAGSLASSSSVYVYGTLDVSAATNPALKSLGGSGTVLLGNNSLTLTAAGNGFTGVISGNGALILNGGEQYLSGLNTMTGGIVINGGIMDVASSAIAYNIANSGTFQFYGSSQIDMTGVISGTGAVNAVGSAYTTISTVQTYTGATTINGGTIVLSGVGSIANSSTVVDNSAFDISNTTSGASITGVSGYGALRLGDQFLTITGAGGDFSGTISGTGGINLTGTTQTLSGTNTYTGATNLNNGTLILATGAILRSTVVDNALLDVSTGPTNGGSVIIGSLSGSGNVKLGANTLVISNAADTFAGVIAGTGGISISSGTETLSGANTYTGVTAVTGGTLALSATGSISSASALAISGTFDATAASGGQLTYASLSGAGTIVMGTHTLALAAASGTFAGVIKGTGGVAITGGSEILSGNSSYTGGTTIASGATLQLGSGASTGSVQGNVVDNGTLVFYRNDSTVFAGIISGTGVVKQSGNGTTILTGVNSYTGGTTIDVGTLQIGNGGTSGSITGNITDNGTLAFSRSDGISYSGVISGTGGLSALTGTTTLTAANTYQGVTKVSSGATLVLSGSGSITNSSAVNVNGTLDVSGALTPSVASLSGSGAVALGGQTLVLSKGVTTFSGVISGSGGIALTTGTQTLSGTSTYTGQTTINGGTLSVTGSIAKSSGVVINSGGTLAGTGTVSGLTVKSGGTVSAGAAGTGTLTVIGDANFASGSTYNVAVTSGAASKLAVSGTATLGGALTVTSTDTTYLLGQKVAVLTASKINGAFSYTTNTFTNASNGALFKSTISQTATEVDLAVDLYKLSPVLPTTASTNQVSLVSGIDAALAAGNTLPSQVEGLGNDSAAQLLAHTTQLTGELGADLPTAVHDIVAPFVESMDAHSGRSGLGRASGHVDGWISALTGSAIVRGDDTVGSHKFRSDINGIALGGSYAPWRNVLVGAALSFETSQFHVAGDLGKGSAKALQGGLYGYLQASPHFYHSAAVAFSFAQLKTDRIVTVSGTDELTGKLNAITFGGRYETGVTLGDLSAYVGAEGQLATLPSYSESAKSGSTGFALHYASRTANRADVEVGLRHQVDIDITPRWILTPDWTLRLSDRVAWVHNFAGDASTTVNFTGAAASSFAVKGAETSSDGVRASVGADFLFQNGFAVTSRLDSTLSKKAESFTGYIGAGYRW